MSPSTKIFEVAEGRDSKGNSKAVALKVFDSQADFPGDIEIQTKHFTLLARGGIIHSTAVREHWKGIHDTATGIIQPFILAPVGGSVLKTGLKLIPIQ